MGKSVEYVSSAPFYADEEVKQLESTAGAADTSGTWWNSQISTILAGKEYTIQFGTRNKEEFDRVSKVCAEILDEKYMKALMNDLL